jgi:hypothetical protein
VIKSDFNAVGLGLLKVEKKCIREYTSLGLLHFFKKITMKILHGRLAFKEEIK